MDTRSKSWIYVDAIQRYLMINTLSAAMPLYIVTEYPKSGGTWLSQMLAEALGIDFPRNRRPRWAASVMHGHYLYTPCLKNVVVLFRDGRDVMVSEYFFSLFRNDRASPRLMREMRRALGFNDYEDIWSNLPKFIEYVFESKKRKKSPFQFTWSEFVGNWMGRKACIVKYENLIDDAVGELAALIPKLTVLDTSAVNLPGIVRKYSFESQTGRRAGEEDRSSFLRKGTYGDWKNRFSRDACEVFHAYAGKELIDLGYERDSSWVKR